MRKDIPLNKTGLCEAARLRDYFKHKYIDIIYTSSLKRAFKTAKIINKFHNLAIEKKPSLNEINFGKWEGLNYKKITKSSGKLFKKWIENPFLVTIPAGENMKEFSKRVTAEIKKILKANKGKTILVVTHGGTLRAILIKLFGILKNFLPLEQKSGCINLIEIASSHNFKVRLLNYTGHLKKIG